MKKRKDFASFQPAPTPVWVVKLVMCSACGEAYGALCIAFLFKMASSRTTYGSNLFFQTRLSFINFMLLACVTGPPTLWIVDNNRKGKGGWVKKPHGCPNVRVYKFRGAACVISWCPFHEASASTLANLSAFQFVYCIRWIGIRWIGIRYTVCIASTSTHKSCAAWNPESANKEKGQHKCNLSASYRFHFASPLLFQKHRGRLIEAWCAVQRYVLLGGYIFACI